MKSGPADAVVAHDRRAARISRRPRLPLKLAQRERALAQGYDLIEWTFDPMQAMNAHFNFAKLGGIVEEYAANFYGESTSALHRGTPTDRVVLSWNIDAPHVVRRLEQPAALRARAARSGRGADRECHRDRRRVAQERRRSI